MTRMSKISNNLKKFIRTFVSLNFLQGGIFYWAASLFGGLMNYFFNSYVGKALGPNGFGDIIFFFFYVIVLSLPTGIVGTFLIIKIGNKKKNSNYAKGFFQWY